MIWLWILVGLAAFFALLCLMRLHLQADFEETVSLVLRIGPVSLQLLPQKKITEEKQKEAPQKQGETPGALMEKLKSVPRPSASDIRDAWQALGPVVKKALRRTRRGIRILPLTVSVILGGREDPARTAEHYGYANAAVWSVMPALEQLVKIPDPSIHIGMDFDTADTQFRGRIGISMRIGTLILLALGISIPAFRWFRRYLKRKKQEKNVHQHPAGSPAV